jgi:4-hydroxy-3-polyprenylbenzoate decarboxylase
MFRDLQEFLRYLEQKGDLKRVKVEVDPRLEITEIVTRVVKEEGPALLFENVKGSSYPIAVNILGASRRIEWALGRHPKEIGEELLSVLDRMNPPSLKAIFSSRKTILKAFKMRTKTVSRGPVQEMKAEPNFDSLPIVHCWPEDGGKFITYGMVLTRDPVSRERNVGVYRMQIYDRAEKSGKPLEAMIVFGGDPSLLISAITPLPEGFDELAFSGFLRGSPTAMVEGIRIQEEIPSHAEFILEGIVPPNEREMEGPFGDHFGHYSHKALFPVFHLKAITHRRDPVFPTSIVGKPPQEDKYLGEAVEEMTFPLLRMIHPEIRDGWAYFEAGFHNLLVISVGERYAKEGMKTALGILGTGQLSLSKCIVLVSEDVNVRSFKDVLGAIRDNFNPQNDFLLIPGVPLDTLDFTSFEMNLGSKMVIDATKNHASRITPASRSFKDPKELDSRIKEWRFLEDVLLVVKVDKDGREILEKLVQFYGKDVIARNEAISSNHSTNHQLPKLIAAVSDDVPLEDGTLLLWGIFTRFDCARDICFTSSEFARFGNGSAWPRYKGILGVDATFKKGYPHSIVMSTEIIKKVDRRWEEYEI